MASRGSQRLTYIFVASRPAVLQIAVAGGTLFFKKNEAIRTNDAALAQVMNANKNFALAQSDATYTVICDVIN